MGRLKLECLEKRIRTKHIAKAVYNVLGQKDKLSAELVFVNGEDIHTLNRNTRGVDSVTDVLSYPSLDGIKGEVLLRDDYPTVLDGKNLFLGSIVMCDDKIRAQAIEFGHSEERERTYLIVHGLLHLFGYDHMNDEDKKEMRAKEKEVLSVLGIGE